MRKRVNAVLVGVAVVAGAFLWIRSRPTVVEMVLRADVDHPAGEHASVRVQTPDKDFDLRLRWQ